MLCVVCDTIADAANLLQSARDDGYDYVTTVLPHTLEPRADVTSLESRWWRTSIVGVCEETTLPQLPQQMEWANHMGIPAVLLPPIPTNHIDLVNYARMISSAALHGANGQLWIKCYLTQESISQFALLHKLCDGPSNVGLMLSLDHVAAVTANPAATVAHQLVLLHKAIGMQLKCVSFPTTCFLTNKRGYPALSKTHQVLFGEVLRRIGRTLRVLVEGPSHHPAVTAGGTTKCLAYLQYIRHLRQRPEVCQLLDSPEASLEEPYLDHLQRPLQPLGDHLEFSTYETFEKDPVKYAEYQRAIQVALMDHVSGTSRTVVILVAGAGRGPLVTCALDAIKEGIGPQFANVVFKIFALEKNPSAIIYLESLARHNPAWKGMVTIVHGDMRSLQQSCLQGFVIDMVVSELLGSFGDNELSPECLDDLYSTGLVKDSTICIPSHYTAYLAPVSSFRLHAEARAQAYFPSSNTEGLDSAPMGTLKAMETPYVVRSHAACQTHMEQPCWDFCHPSPTTIKERTAHVEFLPDPKQGAGCGSGYGIFDSAVANMARATLVSSGPTMVHGFLGTFTAVLYAAKDHSTVELSTRPSAFSTGMFSWFPLYFPLREPILVPDSSTMIASLWRKTEDSRVWYEWSAQVKKDEEVVAVTPIHNPNGRSYYVKL